MKIIVEVSPLLTKQSIKPQASPSFGHGTAVSSYVGIMCAMLGAGIMTIPSTIAATTPWIGLFLLFSTAILVYTSLQCLCLVADATKMYSYEHFSSLFFPPILKWTMRFLIFVPCFGAMIMYNILAMDMLLPFTSLSRPVLCGIFGLLTFPLCLLNSLHALRYSNTLVLFCIFYILCVLGVHAYGITWPEVSTLPPVTWQGIAYAIPIQTFSFCCHFNYMRVYGEIKDKKSMKVVTWCIMATAAAIYSIFALSGYIVFHGQPPHDILTGFAVSDLSISGVRLALALSMLCKMPLAYQPLRDMLEVVCLPPNVPKWRFRLPLTAGFLFVAYLIAITAKDLSYVKGWIGATDGILVAFVVPGMFLLYAKHSKVYRDLVPSYSSYLAISMIVSGLVLCIFSVYKLLVE